MDNEIQIKEIISAFIHKDVSEITANTVIDRTAVRSSIHVHRMYAALAEAGVVVANPNGIRLFGDLSPSIGSKSVHASAASAPSLPEANHSDAPFIGIDIEEISNFSEVTDYREDEFYKQNFSASEIAWCILQPHRLASFAGKFAAKEAIVKADNDYLAVPFHRIVILNTPSGSPQFNGFEISISYTPRMAVAVAVKGRRVAQDDPVVRHEAPARDLWLWRLAIMTFLLALVALFRS
jgi:phosphopantetheine--protein transferase-like protein